MLSKEEIQKIYVQIESEGLPDFQQKVSETTKELTDMREQLKENEKELSILHARGEEAGDRFQTLSDQSAGLKARIKELNAEQKGYAGALDITQMSSKQLSERSKVLKGTLDSMSQSADPEKWAELNQEYIRVSKRLQEVKAGTLQVSDSMDIAKMSMNELAAYSKQLTARMNDIPESANNPEWHNLKKRLDEVKKKQSEVSEQSGQLSKTNVKWATVAANLWTKAISMVWNGIKKIAKDATTQTQTFGDKWAAFTSGMTSAYNQFVASISTGDWSHFFKNLADAYDAGKKVAEMLDELFELNNSLSIKESIVDSEVAKLKVDLRDVNKTNEERLAAGQKIIDLENEIRKIKQENAKIEMEAATIGLTARTGMEKDEREFMIDRYVDNKEAIRQGTELYNLEKSLAYMRKNQFKDNGSVTIFTDDQIEGVRKQIDMLKKSAQEDVLYAATIVEKYNKANDDLIKPYVDAVVKFNTAETEYRTNTARAATQMNTLKKQLSDEDKKRIDDNYKSAIEAAEKQSRETTNILKQQYSSGAITQSRYNVLLQNEESRLTKEKMSINIQYGKDYSELQGKIYDEAISRMEAMNKALEDGNKDLLDQLKKDDAKALEDIIKESDEVLEALSDEMAEADSERLAALMEKRKELMDKFASVEEKVQLQNIRRDDERAQLQDMYDMRLISEEMFQKSKADIIAKYAQQCREIELQGWTSGIQQAQGYLNQISSFISTLKEAQVTALDAQMEKEIKLSGNNAEAREAIEEKYEQKKLDLKKQYADAEMGINIAKAIAAGALASVQAWAAAGGHPALAAAYIALIAATTAVEVATIVAQRNAIVNSTATSGSSGSGKPTFNRSLTGTGYSEGGYTGAGGRLEPAGIVHRGEYVVPQPEMRNPAVLARVQEIEAVRVQRVSGHRLKGYADGGQVSGTGDGVSTEKIIEAFVNALQRNPLKAYVVLSEIQAKEATANRFKKAASRS